MSKVNTKQTAALTEDKTETKSTNVFTGEKLDYLNNLIQEAYTLSPAAVCILNAMFSDGPLKEKDCSDDKTLDILIELNMVARIAVKRAGGYVACTKKGKDANTLIGICILDN